MQDSTLNGSPDISLLSLESINGIQFTRREIDIIACILGGRAVKKIASLLSIAPRTVETHVRNIMGKLSCNSRQGIIDFIEQSGNAPLFRTYYQSLLAEADFVKKLGDICKLIRNKPASCRIVYEPGQEKFESLIHKIKKHLDITGIKTILTKKEIQKLTAGLSGAASSKEEHVFYIIPEILLDQLLSDKDQENIGAYHLAEIALKSPNPSTFIALTHKEENIPSELKQIGYVYLNQEEGYHLFFFKLLRKILPDTALEEIVLDFKRSHAPPQKEFFLINPKLKATAQEISYFKLVINNKKIWLACFGIISISMTAFYTGSSLFKKETTAKRIS